jgi:hypothetical protein
MTHIEKIHWLLKRTAELAANSSTLRGRPPGTIKATRKFLKRIKPKRFVVQSEKMFQARLNATTKRLLTHFPKKAKNDWGAARKVLNIFLRDVLYGRDLCNHFKFEKIEKWLEVPLDGDVAKGLLKAAKKRRLSQLDQWPKIRGLTSEISCQYQKAAKEIAAQEKIAAVDLDLIFWRNQK